MDKVYNTRKEAEGQECRMKWRKLELWAAGDKHSETGGPARLPSQVAGRRGHINWNSVRRGKKYFILGWTEQPRKEKSLLYGMTSPMNQPRKDPFYLNSLSPHSPQFQQSVGATPLLHLWLQQTQGIIQYMLIQNWSSYNVQGTTLWQRGETTEYTEQQPLLSGIHSVMRVKLALAGEGRGCTPTPSHYIYHHQ